MARARVLIVEDEFLVAFEIRATLRENGFEVCDVVGSGEEAVIAAERGRPDCVLMDVSLKGAMGGIEAARRIASQHHIPIVFMTGLPAAEVMEQAREIVLAVCFTKPVDVAELCLVVDRLVAAPSTWGRDRPPTVEEESDRHRFSAA